MSSIPVESVKALDGIPRISAHFFGRFPDLPIAVERSKAMELLEPFHKLLLAEVDIGNYPLITAEQVHGNLVTLVSKDTLSPIPLADGLITKTRGLTLGIYVADCAPVWIVARDGSVGSLVHSGKKGTDLGIVPRAIQQLLEVTSLVPGDLRLVIGPCIRPPCYETDFASRIGEQALACGISDIHDHGTCTACHPLQYYSYRREKGLTGRMLATLTLLPDKSYDEKGI